MVNTVSKTIDTHSLVQIPSVANSVVLFFLFIYVVSTHKYESIVRKGTNIATASASSASSASTATASTATASAAPAPPPKKGV